MKIIYLLIFSLFIATFANATMVSPNDNFNSGTLNTSLWSTSYDRTYGDYYTYAMTGAYYNPSGYNCGGTRLKTNYYLIGDFDATIDIFQISNTAHDYITFRFFNYDASPSRSSQSVDWGFAGRAYGWFPYNSWWWYYGDNGGVNMDPGTNTWYELRIQRIDDDVYTYYRSKGSQNWISQQNYMNFGTKAVYLTLVVGDGSNGTSPSAYIDNFAVTGYADTDPLASVQSIPEPGSFIAIVIGIIAFGIIRKK